jgi:hypothetical protein
MTKKKKSLSFCFPLLIVPFPTFRAIHSNFLHRKGGIDVHGIGIPLGLLLLWSF